MKHALWVIAFAAILLAISGCGEQSGAAAGSKQTGKVAVIDLDRIAKALGRDEVMTAQLQQQATQLREDLQSLQANLQGQLKTKQDQIGEDPTDQEKNDLTAMVQAAQRRYTQAASQADKTTRQRQFQLINDFRLEVTPPARRAASKRGLSVIMVRQANVLYHHPATEITDDVIDEMQGTAPAGAAPAGATTQPSGASEQQTAPSE